jgi:hypothetical protein
MQLFTAPACDGLGLAEVMSKHYLQTVVENTERSVCIRSVEKWGCTLFRLSA